ncbi:Hypothetical_protein [Hexamita inflata]|uniref:Hypothetical_protein n=1 Tax=Hexamita inflata TaxID=28002 RepID=A0AA86PQQ3_9EUKA|nr:Hypothetical protein HINF_LOCUS26964 [Hexamita inflata]
MAPHGAGSDSNYCVNMTSCLAPHMNFWLKLPYLQPPNDLFPPQFCLLKLVQPIGILKYMNESSLRLCFTSLYLYSFRELNNQLLDITEDRTSINESQVSGIYIQKIIRYSYGRWNCFFLFTM